MQQVSNAIFGTEVDTTPLAGEVAVNFVGSDRTAEFLFSVETDRQAVVQRGFAVEVQFAVATEVEVALVGVVIFVDVDSIAAEISAEIELHICGRGVRKSNNAEKSRTCKKYLFHHFLLR